MDRVDQHLWSSRVSRGSLKQHWSSTGAAALTSLRAPAPNDLAAAAGMAGVVACPHGHTLRKELDTGNDNDCNGAHGQCSMAQRARMAHACTRTQSATATAATVRTTGQRTHMAHASAGTRTRPHDHVSLRRPTTRHRPRPFPRYPLTLVPQHCVSLRPGGDWLALRVRRVTARTFLFVSIVCLHCLPPLFCLHCLPPLFVSTLRCTASTRVRHHPPSSSAVDSAQPRCTRTTWPSCRGGVSPPEWCATSRPLPRAGFASRPHPPEPRKPCRADAPTCGSCGRCDYDLCNVCYTAKEQNQAAGISEAQVLLAIKETARGY